MTTKKTTAAHRNTVRQLVGPRPVSEWCKCSGWRENHTELCNHAAMNFCIYCGKPLTKARPNAEHEPPRERKP